MVGTTPRPRPPAGTSDTTGATGAAGTERADDGTPHETTLWRMRTTVQDAPGSLAALCTALASLRVDILTLQTHPLAAGTVDEFLLRAPGPLQARQLTHAVSTAGGSGTWIERADAHDLVDTPTRVLGLATRTALDAAELPSHCGSCSDGAPSTRCPPSPSPAAPPAISRRWKACWRTR